LSNENVTILNAQTYGVFFARNLFLANQVRYERIVEKLNHRPGAVQREISSQFSLPKSKNFRLENGSQTQADRLLVPLWAMRRSQLLSDLNVEINGESAQIVDREQSVRLTMGVLALEWRLALEAAERLKIDQTTLQLLSRFVLPKLASLVSGNELKSRGILNQISRRLRKDDLETSPALENFLASARFLSRRYLLWMYLDGSPGDVVFLRYSYVTRFAAEYGFLTGAPTKGIRLWYGKLKRWVGQQPADVYVPLARLSLAESYHVRFDCPSYQFIETFEFMDETEDGLSSAEFIKRTRAAGAEVLGMDDAGGPHGHLYAYEMPRELDIRTYVHAKLSERPPGSTSSMLNLNILMVAIALFIFIRWQHIAVNPTSLATLALALPGVVALWFSHLFQAEGRARLPFVTRISLWLSIYGSIVILALLLVPSLTPGGEGAPAAVLDDTLRWPFLLLVVLPLLGALVLVARHRVLYHYIYARRQRNALRKYGL
jgi:hypothetical protein